MNRYDPDEHKYYINEKEVPSVTGVIPKPDGFNFVKPDIMEKAREDGNENHSMLKLYSDTGETYKDPMLMAVDNWIKKTSKKIGNPICWEIPLFSEKHKYGGTPDIVFEHGIVDLKRSFVSARYHALQCAGLDYLAYEEGIIKKRTKQWWILEWNGEKLIPHAVYNIMAEPVFIGLVKDWHIMLAYNNYIGA